MKTAILLLLTLALSFATVYPKDIEARTEAGDFVLLHENGTWTKIDDKTLNGINCEDAVKIINSIFLEILTMDSPFRVIYDPRELEDESRIIDRKLQEQFNRVSKVMEEIHNLECPLSLRVQLMDVPQFEDSFRSFVKYRKLRQTDHSMMDAWSGLADQQYAKCIAIRTALN